MRGRKLFKIKFVTARQISMGLVGAQEGCLARPEREIVEEEGGQHADVAAGELVVQAQHQIIDGGPIGL